MKIFSFLVTSLLLIGSIPPPEAVAQFDRGRGGDGVCFYQDAHYQGWEVCYRDGDDVSNLRERRDAISSIRIYGRARVVVYEDTNFEGNSMEFTSDVANLEFRSTSGSRTWNDRIESLRVDSGFGRFRSDGRREERRVDGREGICVFEHADYRGRSECFEAIDDVRDLQRFGNWNDTISSIRIFGRARAVFYQDRGFRGESLFVDRDIRDLARLRLRGASSWNDQISSLQVEGAQGRGRNRAWR